MRSSERGEPTAGSSLDHYAGTLRALLAEPGVTEVCLQRPGEAYLECTDGWRRIAVEWASFAWTRHFARLLATHTDQRVNGESPLLSASLPDGERVQIVLPPATLKGHVVVSVRRPSDEPWSLDQLVHRGFFATGEAQKCDDDRRQGILEDTYAAGDWRRFLAAAVKARLNIVVAGATGSGKTTLTKALIQEIPSEERLIGIEDAAELDFSQHPNSVRLFYSKDDQGLARVSPKQLLEACLRLRPDRILLAELRGEEAYYFLRNVNSGHPGSITSVHAGSTELAFEQIGLLIKESAAGRDLSLADIRRILYSVIDVVVHCVRSGAERRVGAVYWKARRPSHARAT
jgi:type IV secretion system protein VirB11